MDQTSVQEFFPPFAPSETAPLPPPGPPRTSIAAASEALRAAAVTAQVNVEIHRTGSQAPAVRTELTAATARVDGIRARAEQITGGPEGDQRLSTGRGGPGLTAAGGSPRGPGRAVAGGSPDAARVDRGPTAATRPIELIN